ncbi:hypothetical protein LTR08_008709 [Meristemomyces frigidus]|nr:hypothetical protein LTR08_008709 [Meristemomyces frigidus]
MDPYRCAPQEVLPASQYLQDRLQERRAKNTRPKRLRQSDFGPRRANDDDIFLEEAEQSRHGSVRTYDSSPLGAGSRHGLDESGYSRRRSMGVKVLDGQMDRVNKQNFALKLELDHRREHTLKLQGQLNDMRAQVERAEQLEEEHAELLKINSQLVEELEKRDKAVEEAMDIICDLEERIVDMDDPHGHTRPSTANADSGYAGTEIHEHAPPTSPPELARGPKTPNVNLRLPPPAASAASHRLHNLVNVQTPAKLRRESSILSQKKPSTHALRSVYRESTQNLHSVKSFNSLLSKRDGRAEEDVFAEDLLNSPSRLSVLSESSFPSLYSPNKQSSPERYPWEATESAERPEYEQSHFRQASINRVSQWISDGGDVEETPSKSNSISSPLSGRTELPIPQSPDELKFQSLNDALSTASIIAPHSSRDVLQPVAYSRSHKSKVEAQQQTPLQQPQPLSIGRHIFNEATLPPTPESASTHKLRASRSSIANDRSLLDTTPASVTGYIALEPRTRTAPKQIRSSIDLNNAYYSNVSYRKGAFGRQEDESSSDGEEVDGSSVTVRDRNCDYDGFPDGNSILNGTPSRFLKHGKASVPEQLFFNGHDVSPPHTAQSPPSRRQSGSEVTTSPRKPSLGRAETSPSFLGTLGRMVTSGSRSTVDTAITSPRSLYSGTSSNRTVLQTETDCNGSISSELNRAQPHTSRPARQTIGQRTQQLLRRLSNSHSERPEPLSPMEKSSLPTLTSTPSSAYITTVSRGTRRPSTSEARVTPASNIARQSPGSGEGRRPSLQMRTRTEPANAGRAASAAATERTSAVAERSNPFRRSGSVKKSVETPSPVVERDAGKGGVPRRTGSIREAVGGSRRPWR